MIPLLVLVLPGEWAQVPLSDEVRVAHLLDDRVDLRESLRELAAAGGDQLYLEQGTDEPAIVITAWPFPDPSDLTGEELPHQSGYRVLRVTTPGRSSYSVVHPVSGRVLSLTVLATAVSAVWDQLVCALTWEEPGA